MRTIHVLLIICALLFVQCSQKKDARIDNTIGCTFDIQEQLSFEDIDYPDLLGITMQLIKQDSFLLINDFRGDSLIHVFNLNTNKITRKLVRAGNGPNELISPLALQLVDDDLWILCRPLHLLNHMPASSIAGKPALIKDGLIKAEADNFIHLGGKSMIFSGFWDKRYAYMNMDDKEVKIFGDYPDFWQAEKDFPVEAKAMFHQSRFAVNTDKHLFASCSYFCLEIYEYDPSGNRLPELKFRKQLGKYEYDYEVGGRVMAKKRPGADLVSVDIVSGGEYLYILTQDEENKKHRNIMVVDWEGNPVKLLKTGKRITCFTVDENERAGYCIFQDPDDKLASFRF